MYADVQMFIHFKIYTLLCKSPSQIYQQLKNSIHKTSPLSIFQEYISMIILCGRNHLVAFQNAYDRAPPPPPPKTKFYDMWEHRQNLYFSNPVFAAEKSDCLGRRLLLTHWEQRPHYIYCYEGINLYCIIKLTTYISLFSLQFSETWCFVSTK